MELRNTIPAIWVRTTGGAFNALRGDYFAFLADEQKARLERLRQARLLFDGRHREYFLDEARTQFDFPEVRAGSHLLRMYLTYNVLGLISLKGADLLFGEEPLLRAELEQQQNALAALVDRSNLHSLFYGCAVDASYEGECYLEAVIRREQVYLQQVPAEEIFPVGELGPDGQYDRYVRYRVRNVGTTGEYGRPLWLLLETTYAAGSIEQHVYQLGDDHKRAGEVSLDAWAVPAGAPPLKPVATTKITANTITWVPNLMIRGRAVSDYDGAIELQDSLNAKNSQVGRVLMKHADPRLAMPESAFDPQTGNVPQGAEVFAFRSKEEIPQYIVWNAEVEAAMADRAFALNQLLVRTETSPVLLGLKEGAAPDAYKKVRLESFNSLTKAARKAAYWKAGIRRAVGVAQDLEQTISGTRYDRSPSGVAVELRDGIPVDTGDQATELSTLASANLISRRRAVETLLKDPAAVEKELADIAEQLKDAQPSVFMGGGGGHSEPGEQIDNAPSPQPSPGVPGEGVTAEAA